MVNSGGCPWLRWEESGGLNQKIVAVVLNAASEDENLKDRIEDMTKKIMEIHLPKKGD